MTERCTDVLLSTEQIKRLTRHMLLLQYVALILLIYFFAVKDGNRNLFAGKCTRYIIEHKILMGIGGGSQVLIIHENCIQHFFFKENLLFLAAYQFRKNSRYCSCLSQIGFLSTSSLQQTEV